MKKVLTLLILLSFSCNVSASESQGNSDPSHVVADDQSDMSSVSSHGGGSNNENLSARPTGAQPIQYVLNLWNEQAHQELARRAAKDLLSEFGYEGVVGNNIASALATICAKLISSPNSNLHDAAVHTLATSTSQGVIGLLRLATDRASQNLVARGFSPPESTKTGFVGASCRAFVSTVCIAAECLVRSTVDGLVVNQLGGFTADQNHVPPRPIQQQEIQHVLPRPIQQQEIQSAYSAQQGSVIAGPEASRVINSLLDSLEYWARRPQQRIPASHVPTSETLVSQVSEQREVES